MIWLQSDGRKAPSEPVGIAEEAAKELGVPVGILLGTCECETNFRLNLVSSAGAVGPVQFLPKYEADYYRYAGFPFDLEAWESLRGIAGVYKTYAKWAREKHGLKGADCWRFAVSAHRYGQNSKTCLDMKNKRVTDIERHMTRNLVWYEQEEESIPDKATVWAVDKVGCEYSQARRTEEGVFDCSSLVARAYIAQGVEWKCQGAPVPTSQYEPYDDKFELIWPLEYNDIGKKFGGREVVEMADKAGDLQFICTDSSTGRKNRITHVTMVADAEKIVHARGTKYGVRMDDRYLYSGKICAITRYNPDCELRRGMRGDRVKELQRQLVQNGANIAVDGVFGEETEKALQKPSGNVIEVTGSKVNVRKGPGTEYDIVTVAEKGERFKKAEVEGWRAVQLNGEVAYISEKYSEDKGE